MADGTGVAFEQLQAELRQLRAELTASRAEAAGLRGAVTDRERALAEAPERQTALAEVLRVIAASPTDLTAVLQTIAETSCRMMGGDLTVESVHGRGSTFTVTLPTGP